jgi:ADP-heptose:LPS heptosyltransferase
MRVVIPIVAGIGNALMAIPLVRQLKHGRPDAHITIFARLRAMAEIFQRLPEVDDVRMMRGTLRTAIDLRAHHTDLFLIPFPSNRWQYMALALASGARRRIIHSYPVGRFRALGFVRAERVLAIKGIHDVIQNLNLLRPLGIEPDFAEAPRFPLQDEDHQRVRKLLESVGLSPDDRPIAVHPGSARTILAAAKRWPPELYAQLISKLGTGSLSGSTGILPVPGGQRHGQDARATIELNQYPKLESQSPLLILEGPDEVGVADEIARFAGGLKLRVLRLTGPLADAAAVLARCRFYVGSDSGLAHLAAAVGTPPVTIFAPADPDRVCPFGYRHLVVQPANRACAPCFMYPWESTYPKLKCREPMCVRDVSVEQVMQAVERAI